MLVKLARLKSGFLIPKNSMANLAKIEKYLKTKKIKYKVSDLGGEVYKVEDVIKVGVNPDQILKTLIIKSNIKPHFATFSAKATKVKKASRGWEGLEFKNKYFALVLRGKDRVDFKKVRRLFGGKSELAKPEEVKKVAGVQVGAVCPILLGIPIYIDKKVFQTFLRSSNKSAGLKRAMGLRHVNMGSGDLTKELEMDFSDLLDAIREYKVMELASAVDK